MSSGTPDLARARQLAVSPRTTIFGPIAANVAFVLELTLVPLLLPAIQVQFGLSIGDLAWIFNAYGIAVAVGVLFGGWCGDTFNTSRVFGFGVSCFAAGSLIVAAAQSFETLMIGRILQGFGGGIFSPLVPLLLTRASPDKPGRMLIIWGSIAGYIAAFAPLIYGGLLSDHSWKIAFLFNAAIASVALVILNLSPASDSSSSAYRARKDYSGLLRTPNLWVTLVYVFCTYGCITFYLFRLPVWLSSNEIKVASVGFILSILWLTFSGASTLLRNFVDKPHIRKITIAAPILIAAAMPLMFFGENLVLLVFSSVLVGLGLACSNAPSTQLILKFAPKGMSAVSTSLDITFARLGGIVTVGILAETQFEYAAPAIGLSCLLAVLCAATVSKSLSGG